METTVPSVLGQSTKPTAWLVFLDDSAPSWLKTEMNGLEQRGILHPVYVSGPFSTLVAREAVSSLGISYQHLVTTRLDSDDAIGMRFVETIQKHASQALMEGLGSEGFYVNVTRGLQMDRRGQLFQYDYSSNPFISYVERHSPGNLVKTVLYDGRHGFAREHAPVLAVQTEPLWLQIIHGSNLANTVTGTRVAPSLLTRGFTIDLEYDCSSSWSKLAAQWISGHIQRVRRWSREPGYFAEYLRGRAERMVGTRNYGRRR